MAKTKSPEFHLDRLEQQLAIDDVVAVSRRNCLTIVKVIGFSPKMVKLISVDVERRTYRFDDPWHSYGPDMVKVDQSAAVIYLLKGVK